MNSKQTYYFKLFFKLSFFLLTLVFLFCNCNLCAVTNHYKLKVEINPENKFLSVELDLKINSNVTSNDTLKYFLHRQFTIDELSGGKIEKYFFDKESETGIRWIPEGRTLYIIFNDDIKKNESLELSIKYSGTITELPEWSANVITADWVELGLYMPWFPYNPDYGKLTFEIEAECTQGYILAGYGKAKKENGKWFFKRAEQTNDIILCASKSMKFLSNENGTFNIYYSTLMDSTAENITSDIMEALELYSNRFGELKSGALTVIESLREKGGGYARTGLISLAGLSDEDYVTYHEGYIRYLGHEAAHLWWNNAPANNWEDWINEGFAEYSALLVIKKIYGEDSFKKRLTNKEKSLENTPPLWEFDRNDRSTEEKSMAVENNLYGKAPVLINRLHKRIGDEKFFLLCNRIANLKSIAADKFLVLLEDVSDVETKIWFERLLKTF